MVTKKVSKDRYFFFFFFSRRIQVVLAKVAWRSLWTQRWVTFAPEGVWGSASGDLRSPPCGGISDPRPASRHIRSEKEKHAVSSGVLRLFAWTTDDGETCVWGGGAFAEANMGQGVKGKCVSVMGVTRRHGNECHQWRFTPSVVTPRCFWCTAVRIALKSPSVSATSCSLSNILVIQRCVCLMQPQKIVLQIFHEVIGDSERF